MQDPGKVVVSQDCNDSKELPLSPECSWVSRPVRIIILGLGFVLALWIAHVFALKVCNGLSLEDCPPYWPISVMTLRAPPRLYYPNMYHALIGLATVLLFIVSLFILTRHKYHWLLVILFGFVIILGSNLTHGWQYGIQRPIDGLGKRTNQYFHDAGRIEDPEEFFINYTSHQLELQNHSRSHPPGAILGVYLLKQTVGEPAAIAIVIGLIATIITGVSIYSLLRMEFSQPLSGYLTFLVLILPATQIYYIASLDALITSFVLAFYALVFARKGAFYAVLGGLMLTLLSMTTFAFLFVIPPALGYWFYSGRKNHTLLGSFVVFAILHILIRTVSGFSYVESFQIASTFENPDGYRLIAEPANFMLTRLEGLFELILFAGPYFLIVMIIGLRSRDRQYQTSSISIIAIATLIIMMLAGVYRTGETARAVLVLYPLSVFPIGIALSKFSSWSSNQARFILIALFAQGIAMQFIGDYFW